MMLINHLNPLATEREEKVGVCEIETLYLRMPRQCQFILPVEVHLREDEALGSEKVKRVMIWTLI
jgi:hypothetical protein